MWEAGVECSRSESVQRVFILERVCLFFFCFVFTLTRFRYVLSMELPHPVPF